MTCEKILMIGLVTAVCAMSGCATSTVRDARRAQNDDSRIFGERIVTLAETELATNDIVTVADLERVALTTSPAVMQAQQAVLLAQLAVRDIDSSFIPTLDVNAGYTFATMNTDYDNQSMSLDGALTAGAKLNWLVYDFGRTKAAARQAISALFAAELNCRTVGNATVYNVRRSFFSLRRAIELDSVARESLTLYASHLSQMKERLDVGAATLYAVSKAEVDYANARLTAVTASNAVLTAGANLTYALGVTETVPLSLSESPTRDFSGYSVSDLLDIARTNAPALAAMRASADGAKAYVDQTVADLYPSLGVSIELTAAGDPSSLIWNLTGIGNISQSVFAAGRKKRAIEAAVAKLRIARGNVAAEELALRNKLTVAVLDSTRAMQQLRVAEDSKRLAKDNFDLITERYNVGKASELERTDAQVALYSAEAAAVSARYDYLDSQIQIALLIGE